MMEKLASLFTLEFTVFLDLFLNGFGGTGKGVPIGHKNQQNLLWRKIILLGLHIKILQETLSMYT